MRKKNPWKVADIRDVWESSSSADEFELKCNIKGMDLHDPQVISKLKQALQLYDNASCINIQYSEYLAKTLDFVKLLDIILNKDWLDCILRYDGSGRSIAGEIIRQVLERKIFIREEKLQEIVSGLVAKHWRLERKGN